MWSLSCWSRATQARRQANRVNAEREARSKRLVVWSWSAQNAWTWRPRTCCKSIAMELHVMVRFSSLENLLCQVEFCRSNQHQVCALHQASPQKKSCRLQRHRPARDHAMKAVPHADLSLQNHSSFLAAWSDRSWQLCGAAEIESPNKQTRVTASARLAPWAELATVMARSQSRSKHCLMTTLSSG